MSQYTERPESRFLSQEECVALAKRAAEFAKGGGDTSIKIESKWSGNIRYARNHITTSGDVRDHRVIVFRDIEGAFGLMRGNQIDDVGLQASVRRAERLLRIRPERGGTQFAEHFVPPPEDVRSLEQIENYIREADRRAALKSLVQTEEEYAKPKIFFDTTYNLDAESRSAAVIPLIESAKKAGVTAAGFLRVSATGRAVMDTGGRSLYYPYTKAEFSVTVRDPEGLGSGWAGVDWSDWMRVDAAKLSAIALEKCLRSRNPVAVEPGRYTAILEPQAVCDLTAPLMKSLDRMYAESGGGPWAASEKGKTKLGQRVMDDRITISADPMDPDLGFPPFSVAGNVYHTVTWVKNGILSELAYFRPYAIRELGKNEGLPNSTSFRMSGGTSSIDQMISSTKRGLLVTRFSDLGVLDPKSYLTTGYTRDGLWLIENGRISKPVKNFRFRESPLFILNNIEELGVPARVYHPSAPIIVPSLKVRDFSFTSLSEAI